MDSHQLIDAQFDRAVEIVQSLPKNGPIQTDYEEKLAMYRCIACCFHVHYILFANWSVSRVSLYKQGAYTEPHFPSVAREIDFIIELPATVGNVTSTRPGIWDMLGRAKWCVSLHLCVHLPRVYDITCQSRFNSDAIARWAGVRNPGTHGQSIKTWINMRPGGCTSMHS